MKSILALFLIAIISCTPSNPVLKEKDPVEIIKCILSNDQIMDELGNIIVQIEEVVKEGDLSGLTSLLSIFSMVEEVKTCFEEADVPQPDVPQPVTDEEVVLQGPIEDYVGCVANVVSGFTDISSCYSGITNCWTSLPEDEKEQIKDAGLSVVEASCKALLSGHPIVTAICSVVCSLL
jgi:hypothetical protein